LQDIQQQLEAQLKVVAPAIGEGVDEEVAVPSVPNHVTHQNFGCQAVALNTSDLATPRRVEMGGEPREGRRSAKITSADGQIFRSVKSSEPMPPGSRPSTR
jgi:hypothetical protein